MLRHIVLLRLADPSDDVREDVVQQLRKLEGNLPQIRSLSVGPHLLDGPGTYHVALVATFDDPEAFDQYARHEFHQQVWESVKPAVTDVAAIQVDLDA
jgi:hypothetical protein